MIVKAEKKGRDTMKNKTIMNKRRLAVLGVAAALAATLTGGSLAYFTAQDSVENNFMTANSGATGDDLFSISVTETDSEGNLTETGNTYENIKPGDQISKDPTVENTGSYDQWVRVKVTIDQTAAWQTAFGDEWQTELENLIVGVDNTKWVYRADDTAENDGKITYVYYLNDRLNPNAKATLFTEFDIPAGFDVAEMSALAKFSLTVEADAIQADYTGIPENPEAGDTVASDANGCDAYYAFHTYFTE